MHIDIIVNFKSYDFRFTDVNAIFHMHGWCWHVCHDASFDRETSKMHIDIIVNFKSYDLNWCQCIDIMAGADMFVNKFW